MEIVLPLRHIWVIGISIAPASRPDIGANIAQSCAVMAVPSCPELSGCRR